MGVGGTEGYSQHAIHPNPRGRKHSGLSPGLGHGVRGLWCCRQHRPCTFTVRVLLSEDAAPGDMSLFPQEVNPLLQEMRRESICWERLRTGGPRTSHLQSPPRSAICLAPCLTPAPTIGPPGIGQELPLRRTHLSLDRPYMVKPQRAMQEGATGRLAQWGHTPGLLQNLETVELPSLPHQPCAQEL